MKFGIIGCGKMATALVEGALRAGVLQPHKVFGCARSAATREAFAAATGASATEHLEEVAASCDILLLGVKPVDSLPVLKEVAEASAAQSKLIISIAAGISLPTLEAAVPAHFRMVRVMPNTPSLVGKGAAGYCLGSRATASDSTITRTLLEAVGLAVEIPERLMNAITGLSGSGPAYIYLVIEALADGGVRCGLGRAQALELAAQTVLGAATMVLETGLHPAVLKDQVTSPGGTTIAGLAELERRGLRSSLIEAVTASAQRAAELG